MLSLRGAFLSNKENAMTTELNQDLNIEVAEIDQIKQRLDLMGITYHHKANVETLRKLLASSLKPVEQVSANDIMQEATKLIRCKITCMNPGKREWGKVKSLLQVIQ